MNDQNRQDEEFIRENITMRQISFRYCDIVTEPETYSGRPDEDRSGEAIAELASDIELNGIVVPLLGKELPDGKVLNLDGHNRLAAVGKNIADGKPGFTREMLIPFNVLPPGTSLLASLGRAASANTHRRDIPKAGLIAWAIKLRSFHMPIAQIALIIGKSASQVARYVHVGSNPEMMRRVKDHSIQVTDAADLSKLAADKGRTAELLEALDAQTDVAKETIRQEEARRKSQDLDPLPANQTQPVYYLDRKLVSWWKTALEAGQPLQSPGFRYRLIVERDKVGIDPLSGDPSKMPISNLAKVALRLSRGAELLASVIAERVQAERAKGQEGGQATTPGSDLAARLRSLGVAEQVLTDALGPDADEATQAAPEAEGGDAESATGSAAESGAGGATESVS